jgi:two-component system cell cycle sensor histidine kinase/response regulator CckA
MGTAFKIYLPAIEAQEDNSLAEDTSVLPTGGTETILLVDDESSIRDLASRVLLKFGYTPITATSGEEALEIYSNRKDEIDLVVIDLGMPGMGGHKCVQKLLKLNPDIKVIIASGYSINGQVKDTLQAGAKGFVGKPYQIQELLGKVRDVLDGEE